MITEASFRRRPARRDAAIQSYYEWMPIRENQMSREARIYRSFAFGNLADLVMLDRNIFEIAPEEIRNARVVLTVVGGRKVLTGEQLLDKHPEKILQLAVRRMRTRPRSWAES